LLTPNGVRHPLALTLGAFTSAFRTGDCILLTLQGGATTTRSIATPLSGACAEHARTPPPQLSRTPYVGVSCPRAPNSIRCDRIGITVWTKQRTEHMAVRIGNKAIRLRSIGYQPGAGWGYNGFLQPAGLTAGNGPLHVRPDHGRYSWFGVHPVFFTMAIITPGGGVGIDAVQQDVRLELNTGYG
jgi:hypothetical protein